ncbi:adenylyl-sulfate kinase [Paenibacillus amylolyticus]|uniref:Adenylyl-sulfate kinase n=1 Tax=Paenibacillus amylolyticus TaxID=1451 RepID=A0A1R1BQP2_PAEAM|nr:adenylyl-sulfate kinase [Paenibacillus amylolyticus]OMF12117.1 adenylyl-sulfate kinase [Paenibacillus amylolyticus]
MSQRGVTVWFTGLSGAGKTTIASYVTGILQDRGIAVETLDGDVVRSSLCKDLGFSKEDRIKNIERISFVAKLLTKNQIVTLASFISPYKNMREMARQEIGEFIEVFVDAPLSELVKRDVKGLYKKAIAGEIESFTGVNDPYERPNNADLVLRTDLETVEKCAMKVVALLEQRHYITFQDVHAEAKHSTSLSS